MNAEAKVGIVAIVCATILILFGLSLLVTYKMHRVNIFSTEMNQAYQNADSIVVYYSPYQETVEKKTLENWR